MHLQIILKIDTISDKAESIVDLKFKNCNLSLKCVPHTSINIKIFNLKIQKKKSKSIGQFYKITYLFIDRYLTLFFIKFVCFYK